MNIEELFYSKFNNFEISPPDNLWPGILERLESGGSGYYFSRLEKKFLLISGILMAALSFLLYPYSKIGYPNAQPGIQYSAPMAPETVVVDKLSQNSWTSTPSKLPTTHADSRAPRITYTAEIEKKLHLLKESKKEIKLISELIKIDHQIDSLEKIQADEEISNPVDHPSRLPENKAELSVVPISESLRASLNLRDTANSPIDGIHEGSPEEKQADITANSSSDRPDMRKDDPSGNSETDKTTKNEESEKLKSVFNFRGYYLTPFIGANFTQVHYQSQPESPYFSDKAVFTGKMGFNFGLQAGYQFNKYWSLETGISYGQYIQSFRENIGQTERKGQMYIDQIDIPLMARYSFNFGSDDYPKTFSIKPGLIYNSVTRYQVNYRDVNAVVKSTNEYHFDVDKRLYNSLQLGYALGFDFDAFLSRKISVNLSILNALVSQLENFPFFQSNIRKPIQYSTTFSIGTKIRF